MDEKKSAKKGQPSLKKVFSWVKSPEAESGQKNGGGRKRVSEKIMVNVDYPQEKETVSPDYGYAIRISAGAPGQIQVSINGSDWRPCREADGLWWFDWTDLAPGTYTLQARLLRDGEHLSKPRRCVVKKK